MKALIKKENILKIVLLLTVINVAILSTIGIKSCDSRFHDEEGRPEKYVREQLRMSGEQEKDFDRLKRDFRERMRDLRDNMNRDNHLWRTELDKDVPNEERLDSLSLEMGVKSAKMRQLSYRHYLQMRAIMGPDQKKELHRMYRGMFREERGHRHGKRMRDRRVKRKIEHD